jgi:perosamine synthetase
MNKKIELEKLLLNEKSTLKETLSVIDKNARGLCFVVDDSNRLKGVITDGDIRRKLIDNNDLSTNVSELMNSSPLYLPIDTDNLTILKKLNDKIKIIPLVNAEGVILDYASTNKLRRIPVAEPFLNGNELEYIIDCVKSTWISSKGKYINRFQEQLAEFCEMPHALAVSNGTVALHLALEALGIGKGDEVIVPNITFAASINSVIHAGATPVIADIDAATINILPASIEALITPATKAIMPVHLYGYPCDMDAIMAIAKKHNLFVIEDAAEALGAKYKNRPIGSFGDAATFSFFGNKTITTGEGGMVLFKSKEVADRAATLKDHGMNKNRRYWHDIVGYNYRMTNLQAALGVAQMEQIESFIIKKRAIAAAYNAIFKETPSVRIPLDSAEYANSYWLYSIIIDAKIDIDKMIEKLLEEGIETRPLFYPLHTMPLYRPFTRGNYPNSEQLMDKGLSLPSAVTLSVEEASFIAQKVREYLKDHL